jgi:hypothetical protein
MRAAETGCSRLLLGNTDFASTPYSHCAFTPCEVSIDCLQVDGGAQVGEGGGGRRAEYSSGCITCLACSASCVYVGTSTGHILVITFPDAGGQAITHARAETGKGGHAVKQLGGSPIADQLGHILALSGSSLRMHDASSLEQKGAKSILDRTEITRRVPLPICAGVRMPTRWKQSDSASSCAGASVLSDSARCFACGTHAQR